MPTRDGNLQRNGVVEGKIAIGDSLDGMEKNHKRTTKKTGVGPGGLTERMLSVKKDANTPSNKTKPSKHSELKELASSTCVYI